MIVKDNHWQKNFVNPKLTLPCAVLRPELIDRTYCPLIYTYTLH